MEHELELLEFVMDSHKGQTRRWDGKTPYSIHPIWCAYMLLTETGILEENRNDYFQAMLCHDIYEDTDKELPYYISEKAKQLVKEMTFKGGMNQEIKEIWKKSPEVRLLKLYDKVSNLLDGTWMEYEKLQDYKDYVAHLLKDVEKNYGELNIIKLAKTLI